MSPLATASHILRSRFRLTPSQAADLASAIRHEMAGGDLVTRADDVLDIARTITAAGVAEVLRVEVGEIEAGADDGARVAS